jgi:integrase
MQTAIITARVAEDLSRGETAWDAKVAGFGVRRQRRDPVYFVKYRDPAGRQKWHTIGKHGLWSADSARKEARRILGLVLDGRDQAAARVQAKAGPTLAEFADRYMREYALLRQKPRTRHDHQGRLDGQILPMMLGKLKFGDLKLTEIDKTHVAKLHASLGPAGPVSANRAIDLLSAILNWAERVGERPDHSNPCRHVTRYPEKPRERLVTAEELARLGDALASNEGDYWRAVAVIRLLMFTGARKGEILSLRWEWIDAERGRARLPDSKTGAKNLYLPPPALAVLASLPRINGNPHVIPGDRAGAHFTGLGEPWRRIRTAAGLDDLRIHDLRHLVASTAVEQGDSLYIVGKLLGHRVAATTARYAHLAPDPVSAVAARTAQRIDDMLRGRKASVQ